MRERLLRAALELFTRRGYDQTSLDQVAGAAGFTKGAVYSNFTSKDELFLTLMDQQVGRRIDQVREALRADGGRADSARRVGDRLTAALDEDREWQLLFLDYVLRAARDEAVREQFVAHRRRIRSLVADAVRELVSLPEGSGLDVDAIASTLLALQNGLGIERLVEPAAVRDDLLGTLLQALQPPGTTIG